MQPGAGHPCTPVPQDQGCKGLSLAGESLLHQMMLNCLWETDPSLALHLQIFLGRHKKRHLSGPVPSSGQLPTLAFLQLVLPQGFHRGAFPLEGLESALSSRQSSSSSSSRENSTPNGESRRSRARVNAGARAAKRWEMLIKSRAAGPTYNLI